MADSGFHQASPWNLSKEGLFLTEGGIRSTLGIILTCCRLPSPTGGGFFWPHGCRAPGSQSPHGNPPRRPPRRWLPLWIGWRNSTTATRPARRLRWRRDRRLQTPTTVGFYSLTGSCSARLRNHRMTASPWCRCRPWPSRKQRRTAGRGTSRGRAIACELQ